MLREHAALKSIIESVGAFEKRLKDAQELFEIADDEVFVWLEREVRILSLWMKAMEVCASPRKA